MADFETRGWDDDFETRIIDPSEPIAFFASKYFAESRNPKEHR